MTDEILAGQLCFAVWRTLEEYGAPQVNRHCRDSQTFSVVDSKPQIHIGFKPI